MSTFRLRHWIAGQRWLNRPRYAARRIYCALVGHDYAQHFTEMGAASPEDNEPIWCWRCGSGL